MQTINLTKIDLISIRGLLMRTRVAIEKIQNESKETGYDTPMYRIHTLSFDINAYLNDIDFIMKRVEGKISKDLKANLALSQSLPVKGLTFDEITDELVRQQEAHKEELF